METPKRARSACGYLGCTRDEYHAGLCSVAPPPVKRHAPMPRRIASKSMATDAPVKSVPISAELTTEALSELFDHSVGDLLFTIDEVQELINML